MKRRHRKFKLKISEYGIKPEDRESILNKHRHLSDLKIKAKAIHKDNKDLINIFKLEINAVRQELMENYAHKFFLTTIVLGPHKEEQYFPYYPTSEDVIYLKDKLLTRLSKDRKNKKEFYKVHKNFNGIEYDVIGTSRSNGENRYTLRGLFSDEKDAAKVVVKSNNILPNLKGGGNVFVEPGTMLKFLSGPGYANRIKKAKKPYDKSNYVGVEIELICKSNRETLEKKFIEERLANNVYIKDDSSIQRESDGEWTHEITLISKQQNINNVITKVCDVLNSKDIGAYVNDSCGIHVHVDMRNRDYIKCYKNFVNSLTILSSMVPASRIQSRYCMLNTSDDFTTGRNSGRRQAINPMSFESHNTLEIRLHSGSTNGIKINNWVNILIAIAERSEEINYKVASPEEMQDLFGIDSKLVEYIKNRIDKFKNNKTLNTKDDHFDQTA